MWPSRRLQIVCASALDAPAGAWRPTGGCYGWHRVRVKRRLSSLPLLAYLVKESARWTPSQPTPAHSDDWWSNDVWKAQCKSPGGQLSRSYRVPQRSHETRPAAVRGLILYPMNALVEDQLTRLRRAFDSPEARDWFSTHRPGNRIYFGRYNGETPVAGYEFKQNGRPNREKIEELADRLSGNSAIVSRCR